VDVTNETSWSVAGGIGTIETTGQEFPGLFTATNAGSGTVSASYSGYTANASVTVSSTGVIAFTGDSTNFTCCYLWCCYSDMSYCASSPTLSCSEAQYPSEAGLYCTPSPSSTWVNLCSANAGERAPCADFLEWTTPSLEPGTYEINGLAACAAYGSCSGYSCQADLYIDNNYVTSFTFTDTDTSDREFTPSTYSYNVGTMSGSYTIRLVNVADCYDGPDNDLNFIMHDINLVKTS
jgi:hypothetical protein